jgi:hypothetical protein
MNLKTIIHEILSALGLVGSGKATKVISKLESMIDVLEKAEGQIIDNILNRNDARDKARAAFDAAEDAHTVAIDDLAAEAERTSRIKDRLIDLVS